MSEWAEILDLFERQLDEYQLVLDEDVVPPATALPPAGVSLGSPSAAEGQRALELLQRADVIARTMTERRDTSSVRRSRTPRRRAGVASSMVRSL